MVVVLATMNNGHCQLIVKDNGIGFDTQYIDRIFKPFQRLHNREEFEGTGMGLAICRRIVERHHGEITATSLPGEGSTFIVTLPTNQTIGDSQYES
jgi:signal transduction histidine kinase